MDRIEKAHWIEYTLSIVTDILKKHPTIQRDNIEVEALGVLKEAIDRYEPAKGTLKKRISFLISHRLSRIIKKAYQNEVYEIPIDNNQPYMATNTNTQVISQFNLNKDKLPENRRKIADMILINELSVAEITRVSGVTSTSVRCISNMVKG